MPLLLSNLANSFTHYFGRTGDLNDICEAVSAQQRAVRLTPDSHPDKPRWLSNLGNSFSRRFKYTGDSSDVENAITVYRQCATITSAPPFIRLRAALRWTVLSVSCDPSKYLHTHNDAINLISQIAGVDLRSQSSPPYTNISRITATAASAAFAQGDIQKALDWLEQGRCVVWNQLKQLCTPMGDLPIHGISSFWEASRVLASPASLKSLQELTTHVHTATAVREWTRLLDEIRSFYGFHNFQEPLPASTILKNLPQGGTVVLISVHEDRYDAVALMQGTDTPLHVPLWHFTLHRVLQLIDHLSFSYPHGVRAHRAAPSIRKSNFLRILKELWLCVVKPVLDALGFSDKVGSIPISNASFFIYLLLFFYKAPSF